MSGRPSAILLIAFASLGAGVGGCEQLIGIRELGVEPSPAPTPSGDGGTSETVGPGTDAGTDAVPDAADCSVADISGRWNGTFVTKFSQTFNAVADLVQTCTRITGSMAVTNCMTLGNIDATFDERGNLNGTVTSGDIVITLRGSLAEPDHITGDNTLTQTSFMCLANDGTFDLQRR